MMTFLPRTSRCLYAFRAVGLIAVAAAMLPWVPLQAQVNPVEVQLERLSETLLGLAGQALGQSPADAASSRRQAEQVIVDRLPILVSLIEEDPEAALRQAFPSDVADRLRQTFPDSALGIEQYGAWVGVLEVEVEDNEDFTESKTIRHLRVGPDRFRVFFATEEDVESAEYIRAEGMLAGMTLALSGAESQTGAEAGQACSTTGDQRFAVIKVKIGNPTTANPSYATTTLSDYLFGTSGQTLSEYWNEASHGLAWASGDIYPQGPDEWYDLTSKNYSCNSADGGAYYGYPTLRSDALAAADPDVDFNNVERALIIFSKPNGLGCFAGVASIGCWLGAPDGSPSISYALQVFEYMDTRNEAVELTSHEGAHNLSLYHSSSKDYGAEPLGAPSDSGSTLEYGDRYSAVGFWNKGHYAPQHNAKIGWTSGSETITSSVVRTILPNNQSGGLEALKVKRGTEGSQNLWLEFRARQGLFYSTIVNDPSNGALIHLDNGTAQSVLLDFTPGSNNSCNSTYCLDFYDAPLTDLPPASEQSFAANFLNSRRLWDGSGDRRLSTGYLCGSETPNALRISVWRASGIGSRVTLVCSSTRYSNRHSRPNAASASGKVIACGSSSVVPNAACIRRSNSRLSFNASMLHNTCPRVRLSLRTKIGRTSSKPVFSCRKSRSTRCRLT